MCTFTLSVSVGAILLLPVSIVSNEVLLLYPNSYYVQWLNSSLIIGKIMYRPASPYFFYFVHNIAKSINKDEFKFKILNENKNNKSNYGRRKLKGITWQMKMSFFVLTKGTTCSVPFNPWNYVGLCIIVILSHSQTCLQKSLISFIFFLFSGFWNNIFLISNLSLFFFMPFAYFFTESEGFVGVKKVAIILLRHLINEEGIKNYNS